MKNQVNMLFIGCFHLFISCINLSNDNSNYIPISDDTYLSRNALSNEDGLEDVYNANVFGDVGNNSTQPPAETEPEATEPTETTPPATEPPADETEGMDYVLNTNSLNFCSSIKKAYSSVPSTCNARMLPSTKAGLTI